MDKHTNMKKCNKCNELKLENEFYNTSRTSTCKKCHLEITREYKRKKREDSNYREIEGVKQKERRCRLWQNTLIHDCKGRKYDVDIDIDYINKLFEKQNGKCYWFGVDLIPTDQKKHPQQPSLDRLDTTKGYVKGNVVLSCYSANIGRNETNVNVWVDFLNKIKPIIKYEDINI